MTSKKSGQRNYGGFMRPLRLHEVSAATAIAAAIS